jgi:hypothetical protein
MGILITFWWHLWKERNRRIFDRKEQSVPHLAFYIHDELRLLHNAIAIPLVKARSSCCDVVVLDAAVEMLGLVVNSFGSVPSVLCWAC